MKRLIMEYWWQISGAKRFRIKRGDNNYSHRMSYKDAYWMVRYFGGQIMVDHNKILID